MGELPFTNPGASTLLIDGSLQSWITDKNLTVYAPIPENFRCIISGPSECGKTYFLLKNLIMPDVKFDW